MDVDQATVKNLPYNTLHLHPDPYEINTIFSLFAAAVVDVVLRI